MAALTLLRLQPLRLEPIDLQLAAGELVFISGPSGAGKSLLLRAIADLDPNAGEVLLDQQPRSELPAPEWRRRVGLLPAESGWWADRVGAHFIEPGVVEASVPIAGETGAHAHARDSAQPGASQPAASVVAAETAVAALAEPTAAAADRQRAQASPLHPLLAQLGFEPDALDWDVLRLSTGERQRLALARLLANRPEVLLLDEATANLDPANRERAERLIDAYRRNHHAAVLWASHDADQRERLAPAIGGRRFVVDAGRLQPE
jgi:ABC-type iron transport system FetAB ATPase subunit